MAKAKIATNVPVEDGELPEVSKVAKDIKPPAALRPGVDWDGLEAEITSEPLNSPDPDWDEILQKWGYSPEEFEICEPVKVSQWEVIQGDELRTLYSYKAGVKRKSKFTPIDYKDLVAEIKRHRKLPKNLPGGDGVFVVCLSDWQLGKADGDGVKGTVQRILLMIDTVEERIRELRKLERKVGTLLIAGLGDIIESCDGQYASQTFTVELNRREQVRVARRLVRDAICRWAKLFPEVIVTAVPGNHGENRKDGRAYTTVGDNDDVAVFEMVCDILSANKDAYGHVKFLLPEDDAFVVLDLAGTRIGFAHGHLTGSGGTGPQAKIRKWWGDQAFCNTDIGTARILITGHYHHLSVIEYDNDKIHMQCPAMDGGSDWWVNKTGENSRPGTLTFTIVDGKYGDLQIC